MSLWNHDPKERKLVASRDPRQFGLAITAPVIIAIFKVFHG
jgi:hypothetical protein